ncbi:MAG: hypothetical protein RSP_17920 [Rhodanobacter sp.]
MERAQRHHKHTRHLYGLLWHPTRQCYIGQTVDMERRRKEHARAWSNPFEMIHLETMEGTQLDAEDHEYAWRFRCSESGWVPLGKTREGKVFVIQPRKRMTPARHAIAQRCRWPKRYRINRAALPWWFQWMFWQGAALAGVVLTLRLPL